MAKRRLTSDKNFEIADVAVAVGDEDYIVHPNSDGSINVSTEGTDSGNINIVIQATDENGNHIPISAIGPDNDEMKIINIAQEDLLVNVIQELKIMNMHLSLITSMTINKEEVEV